MSSRHLVSTRATAVPGALVLIPEWQQHDNPRGRGRRTRRFRFAIATSCHPDGIVRAHQLLERGRIVRYDGVVEGTRAILAASTAPGLPAAQVLAAVGPDAFLSVAEAEAHLAQALRCMRAAMRREPVPRQIQLARTPASHLRQGDVVSLPGSVLARITSPPGRQDGSVLVQLRLLGLARRLPALLLHPRRLLPVLQPSRP